MPKGLGRCRAPNMEFIAIPLNRAWRKDSRVKALVERAVHAQSAPNCIQSSQIEEITHDILSTTSFSGMWQNSPGFNIALGLSASHEREWTYVAAADRPLAIDACSLDRWPEIARVSNWVFTLEEQNLIRTRSDFIAAWTTAECACKLFGSSLFDPGSRQTIHSGLRPKHHVVRHGNRGTAPHLFTSLTLSESSTMEMS